MKASLPTLVHVSLHALNVQMDWILSGVCSSLFTLWWLSFTPFAHLSVDRLQPNVDTRQKQLAAWCSLALSYCRHHKLYTLDVMEAQESPVFNNKKIERILSSPPVAQSRPAFYTYIIQLDPRSSHELFPLKHQFQIHIVSVCVDCLILIASQGFTGCLLCWNI